MAPSLHLVLIGRLSDARQAKGIHSFDPIVVVAGPIPFIGMILVLLLIGNTRANDRGLVRRIHTAGHRMAQVITLSRSAGETAHDARDREKLQCRRRESWRGRHSHCRIPGSPEGCSHE